MEKSPLLIAIRLRGPSGNSEETEYTLRLLSLSRANWAAILPSRPSILGMLHKVSAYVCWGEASVEALKRLLGWAEVWGGKELEEGIKTLGARDAAELAEKLLRGEISLSEFKKVFKPRIRLHPPKGGLKRSIKKPFRDGGVTGYIGRDIERLVFVMS